MGAAVVNVQQFSLFGYPTGQNLAFMPTVGNRLVAIFQHSYSGCPPSVSDPDNGVWEFHGTQYNYGGDYVIEVFSVVVAVASQPQITFAGNCGSAPLGGIFELSGIDTVAPYLGENGRQNSTINLTSGTVAVSAGDILIGLTRSRGGSPGPYTPTNGTVIDINGANAALSHKVVTVSNNDQLSMDGGNGLSDYGMYGPDVVVAAFRAASAGGTPQAITASVAISSMNPRPATRAVGGISRTLSAVTRTWTFPAATATVGAAAAQSRTPSPATVTRAARTPTITMGGISRTSTAATAARVTRTPTFVGGAITASPLRAISVMAVRSPSISTSTPPDQTIRGPLMWIRYKDTEAGAYTEVEVRPRPTAVDYPDRRSYKIQPTEDGANVVQRPLRDSRPRRWIWKDYNNRIPAYVSLWALLETLEYRYRVNNGLWPLVEIWEGETGTGGFDDLNGNGTKKYTVVKLLQVQRKVRDDGAAYGESTIEFVIEDPTYSDF